jgi:hypothetical protein
MIRKNKKFIDPRYFMDEKMELLTEAPVEFSDAQRAEHPGIGTPGFQGSSLSSEEQRAVTDEMDVGIAREFAQDVVEYVRQEIIPEQAPAMADMSISDFLRLAADMAGDDPMAVDRWKNK